MNQLSAGEQFFVLIILLLQVFWKMIAVWRAATGNQKVWFVILLILFPFTYFLALPEIVYLFWFAKKRLTIDELIGWFHHARKKIRRRKN